MNMVAGIYDAIAQIVGEKYLISDPERLYNYARDYTSPGLHMPAAVVIPGTVTEIAAIVKYCNEHHISITVRAGGTGVSGGAFTDHAGLLLSMERLDKIIAINKIDRTVVAEAGVTTQALQQAVLAEGLCFPQNISSAAACFIGGNAAVAGGSPKSLKYGPTRNYILNMEVVLPDGNVIWTGKNITKDATGYNLTQLIAGSEGTLGIITKVVLRLVKPVEETLLMVPFRRIDHLFSSVHQLLEKGFTPSCMEFIDGFGYRIVSDFLGSKLSAESDIEGILWIELEGENQEALVNEMAAISTLMYQFTDYELSIAQTGSEIQRLWRMRAGIGDAVIRSYSFRDVDIIVPCSKIQPFYAALQEIAARHELAYTAFGHIGNGNFHINLLHPQELEMEEWKERSEAGITQLFGVAVGLGGTISGEHGVGSVQRPYLNLAVPEQQQAIMKAIKALFDPHGILNPGKIFS